MAAGTSEGGGSLGLSRDAAGVEARARLTGAARVPTLGYVVLLGGGEGAPVTLGSAAAHPAPRGDPSP